MTKMALVMVAAAAFGLTAVIPNVASAQSDRSLGIGCNVAGREHCGERGPLGRYGYRWYHRHWHYSHYGYRY